MENSTATVNLILFNDGTPDYAQMAELGKITIADAHHIFNKTFDMMPTRNTCFGYIDFEFTDHVIRAHGTTTRLPALNIYPRFSPHRCTLCGGAKTSKACAHNIRLGKCQDDFMTQIAALVYPKQYQK